MENILFWLIVGVVSGWLANIAIPGEAPNGLIGDFIVGILGAVAGGFVFNNILGYTYYGLIGSTIVAFVGAVVMLFVLRFLSGKRLTT